MNRDYFEHLLSVRPFVPFAVHLCSGQIYQARYSDCCLLMRMRMVIVDPHSDSMIVCAYLDITCVRMLQTPAPAA